MTTDLQTHARHVVGAVAGPVAQQIELRRRLPDVSDEERDRALRDAQDELDAIDGKLAGLATELDSLNSERAALDAECRSRHGRGLD